MELHTTTPVQTPYTRALIYSPPRHGKTTFVSTAQDDDRTSPLLLIAFEAGLQSIVHRTDIEVFRVKRWEDFNEVGNYLMEPGCKFKSIGIDSITEIHNMNLLDTARRAAVEKKEILPNDYLTQPQDVSQNAYGKSLREMRFLIRFFCDLPLHVFITALVDDAVDPATMMPQRVPAVMGKFKQELPSIPDIVAYLGLGEVVNDVAQRILLCQPNGRFIAGARTPGKFPAQIVDPTVTRLLDAIEVAIKN